MKTGVHETGNGRFEGRGTTMLRTALIATLALFATMTFASVHADRAAAAAPVIVNHQGAWPEKWLESLAVTGKPGNPPGTPYQVTMTLLVKHDPGRIVRWIKIDDDYNGSDDTASKPLIDLTVAPGQPGGPPAGAGVSREQPTIAGGYDYTRITYTYNAPVGADLGSGDGNGNQYADRPIRILAVDDASQSSPSRSTNLRFVRYDRNAQNDFPVIYQRGQNLTSITPGQTVNFTFTGDDSDGGLTTNRDFSGIDWRLRRLSDGATTSTTRWCENANWDNTQKSLDVQFNRRGRWVLEANLLNWTRPVIGSGQCISDAPGTFWRIGSVDVNSPASASPHISLSATRPHINGNTVVTATVDDSADAANGGVGQDIEWDDNNDGTWDGAGLGDWLNGFTALPQRQRTIDTTGMTPGLHTVKARVGDNGALGGADNIRRTKEATTQFLVDTPPVALPGSDRTITGDPVDTALAGTDVDGDTLTFHKASDPAHGAVSISAGTATYTPVPGYAGTDSFTFTADDGYGGVSAPATVDLRVDPDLDPLSGTSGTRDSRSGEISFGSHATGATFECQLDGGGPWVACNDPYSVTDLPDGPHTLTTRVTANGLTNPDYGTVFWTVDAYPKITGIAGPPALTDQTGAAVDFTLSEDGATVTPTAECKLDGLEWAPCESGEAWDGLDDGPHQVRVRATDAFGKQTTETVEWDLLTDGGSTAIEAPYPPSFTRDTDAEISFSGSANTDHTECELDGDGNWQTCTSPATVGPLAGGEHTFRVRSVNQLGKVSDQPAQITWTVDRTPPGVTITSGPHGTVPHGPTSFTFDSSESFTSFECRVDDGAYQPCSSPFDLPGSLADGDHFFRVAGIDRAGNRSLAPRRDFRLVSSAPAVSITSGPADGSTVRSTVAGFEFEAATPAAGFECKLDQADWAPCASPAAATGLTDGDHAFSVRAIDEVGHRSADPATRTWKVDTTPPATTITDGPSGRSGSATAKFTFGSSESGSTFECALDAEGWQACASPAELTGLADGPHEFRVRSTDATGNTDRSPDSRAWTVDTTDAVPDGPPVDPESGPCDFSRERVRCGDPYLTASGRASYRKQRGKGLVNFQTDSGGAELSRILAKLPAGLTARALSGKAGRKVGSLALTGPAAKTVPLKLARKVKGANVLARAAGGPTVTLKARSIVIDGLPPGTTGARLKLKSSRGLGLGATVCGTRTWRAILSDAAGATRQVSAKGDVKCVRKGNR